MNARARVRILVPLVSLAAWGVVAPVASAALAVAADSPRCETAVALVDAGHPQEAAELIDTVRRELKDKTQCAEQSALAADAIASARDAARAAAAAAAAVPEEADPEELKGAWEEVLATAKAAHQQDLDNAQANAVLKLAQDSVDELEEADLLTTRVHERAETWASWAKDTGSDLLKLGAVAVSTAALILLCARLLLLAPARLGRISLRPPRWIRSAPLALAVDALVAVATAWWLADAWSAVAWPKDAGLERGSAADLLLLVGAVLVAIVLTWGWLFHRGRVAITMQDKGKESTAGAAAVVGHLRALGANPPRGLEVPLGVDAQTLSASNITAPALKGLVGGVLTFLQSALSVTPWRVLVDKDSDEQTVAIISRHGRVQQSTVIRSDLFGKDGPKVDHLKLVAAFALMAVLDSARSWRGLGGTRDWQSIGLQYDAVTNGSRESSEKLQLLARAVDLDPGSWLARMSYRITRSRNSADSVELRQLSDWLRDAAQQVDTGDEALKVRMRYAAYAAHLNHRSVLVAAGGDCLCPKPTTYSRELHEAIEDLRPKDQMFAVRVRAAARALDTNGSVAPPGISAAGLTPRTAFTYACFWAQQPGDAARATAIGLLKFAATDPGIKEAAGVDPMLSSLRDTTDYRSALGPKPRAELTEIAPFDAHKNALAAVGLTDPALFSQWDAPSLAAVLGRRPPIAQVVLDRAAVVAAVPSTLSEHRLEIADALATIGIDTPSLLAAARIDPAARAEARDAILKACSDRGIADPDEDALDEWLAGP